MKTPVSELDPLARSKAAFWQMIDHGRSRGYISADDLSYWSEWEVNAYDLVATALFYPESANDSRYLLRGALFEKEVTSALLLKNIEILLRDVWHKEPGKAEYFLSPVPKSHA